jgi:rod shape-determining protein MreD
MKQGLALAVLGVLTLVLQGALATIVPPLWCPDLALLVVISIALRWRGLVLGLCLATALGFAADLLSGSLMGQHALLRMMSFIAAFFAGRQLNLKGSFPLAIFVAGVTVGYGLLLVILSDFFVGGQGLTWGFIGALLQHSAVNGLFALPVLSVVGRAAAWAGDDEAGSRILHIDARRRTA